MPCVEGASCKVWREGEEREEWKKKGDEQQDVSEEK